MIKGPRARRDRSPSPSPGLAGASCLLLLAGLSCKYDVTLPWTPHDAAPPIVDAAFDQAPRPAPDGPVPDLPGPDASGCPRGMLQTIPVFPFRLQILVAIDRSTSMQRDFGSSTKVQEAWAAFENLVVRFPGITFEISWFPGLNCGNATCCASRWYAGAVDLSAACKPFDTACLMQTNASPSHLALNLDNEPQRRLWSSAFILITDQNPTCTGDAPGDRSACDAAIGAAKDLGTSFVQTFVVVPNADGRSPDCLTKIATQNAHSFSDVPQRFVVQSPQDLRAQLDRIVGDLAKNLCRFYVRGFGGPSAQQAVQVKIGDEVIPRDDSGTKGWRMEGDAIVLSADTCARTTSENAPAVQAVICMQGGARP